MFEHTAFARVRNVDEADSSTPSLPGSRPTGGVNGCEFDELLTLAREAGMLIGVIVRFVQFLAVLVGKTLSINELLASSIRVFNWAAEPCWAPLCACPAPYLTRKVREPLLAVRPGHQGYASAFAHHSEGLVHRSGTGLVRCVEVHGWVTAVPHCSAAQTLRRRHLA